MPGIFVRQFDEDLLEVQTPYHDDYIKRLRNIDGSEWDDDLQRWLIPIESVEDLDEFFEGELIYVGISREDLLGLPPKPIPKSYKKIKKRPVPNLKMPLRKFQEFGVNFLSKTVDKNGVALLGDLMGTGKTFQSIAAAIQLKNDGLVNKVLVVVLAPTRRQWLSEVKKFSHEKAMLFGEFKAKYRQKDGVKFLESSADDQKKAMIEEFKKNDDLFMVMSYQSLQQNGDLFEQLDIDLLICDEAHYMKNRESKTNKAAKKLILKRTKRSKFGEYKGIPHVLLVTGTPIMNYPDEIYGLIGIVGDRVFGKWREFRAEYCVLNQYKDVIGYQNLDYLQEIVQDFMIRRTDKEIGMDLPKIIEEDVYIEPHAKQKKLDAALLKEQAELMNQRNPAKAKMGDEKALIIEAKLKGIKNARIAGGCHPNTFQLATNEKIVNKYTPYYVKDLYEIPKFARCMEITREAIDNGHKVVIFVNSKRMTKLFEQELNKFTQSIRYVGGLNDKERERRKDMFNSDPSCMVIICNSAGSTGINLQAGRYLINYDLPHNPAEWEQRKYRIRRLDSTHKNVHIYNLINEGLVDEQMREALSTKQASFDGTIENNSATQDFHKEMNS